MSWFSFYLEFFLNIKETAMDVSLYIKQRKKWLSSICLHNHRTTLLESSLTHSMYHNLRSSLMVCKVALWLFIISSVHLNLYPYRPLLQFMENTIPFYIHGLKGLSLQSNGIHIAFLCYLTMIIASQKPS